MGLALSHNETVDDDRQHYGKHYEMDDNYINVLEYMEEGDPENRRFLLLLKLE
jgi:hypothetical protein